MTPDQQHLRNEERYLHHLDRRLKELAGRTHRLQVERAHAVTKIHTLRERIARDEHLARARTAVAES